MYHSTEMGIPQVQNRLSSLLCYTSLVTSAACHRSRFLSTLLAWFPWTMIKPPIQVHLPVDNISTVDCSMGTSTKLQLLIFTL